MPIQFEDIVTEKNVQKYLNSRGIKAQYIKAAKKLLAGDTRSVSFKIRKPKQAKIYQFKINDKFRAYGYKKGLSTRQFFVEEGVSV